MTVKKTYTVTGMHCVSCGLLVDDEVEEIAGVLKSETNFKTSTTEVTYDGELDDGDVIEAIANAGYVGEPAL